MSAWERLNPQLLRHFLAINRCGSLSAAAEHLHCVPSNVSARLRQLEGQLGAKLFQRQAQRLHLTPAGERLLPYAEQLDRLCLQAWRSVQDDLWSGTLRLGAMETCAAVRLPEVLATFHRDAPRVQLSLRTGTSSDLLGEVLSGRLDAALIGGPYRHPALRCEAIWPERLALVTAAGVHLPQVLEQPVTLIGFPGGCHYQQRLERWGEEQGLRITARQSYGSLDAIFASIAAGMGIGMLPLFLRQSHARGALVAWRELPAELADAPTLLVRRQDAAEHPALEHLLELLRARRGANE